MTNNMNWDSLLCKKKILRPVVRINDDNDRSEFERDHNKIIFSQFFRNLQNKTQLFPISNSNFVHSRLTHSLEVASVGKSIGDLVAKELLVRNLATGNNFRRDVADVVSAACLLHDIGNPPFGHAGEDAISNFYYHNNDWLKKYVSIQLLNQLEHFDGNAQALRIIHNSNDLNLTFATTAALLKYPNGYRQSGLYNGKHSVFSSENALFIKVAKYCQLKQYGADEYCRHPLAFLVEAADDICYRILDLEDAYKLKLIDYKKAEELLIDVIANSSHRDIDLVLGSLNGLNANDRFSRMRSYILNILISEIVTIFLDYYEEIISGKYSDLMQNGHLYSLVDMLFMHQSKLSKSLQQVEQYVKNNAYFYQPVLEIELSGYEVLGYLLTQFVEAITINRQSLRGQKLLKILPNQYQEQNQNIETQILLVNDYIASMPDRVALELYRKLKGIELPGLN